MTIPQIEDKCIFATFTPPASSNLTISSPIPAKPPVTMATLFRKWKTIILCQRILQDI